MSIFDSLPGGLVDFFVRYEYLALLLVFLISEAGVPLPFPNYLLILYATYLLGEGKGNVFLIFASAALGMILGAGILYWIAQRGGHPLLQRYGRYIKLQPDRLARVETWLKRRGGVAIFLGRLTPGIRVQTALVAGLFRVPGAVFATSVTLSAMVWISVYVLAGILMQDQYERLYGFIKGQYVLALGILALAFIVATVMLLRGRLRRREA
ncbi:MAG: DedA family protein [Dehalococcoidia bacterium]